MEKTEKTRSLLELSIQSYEGTSNAIFNWVVKQRSVCQTCPVTDDVVIKFKESEPENIVYDYRR